MGRMEDVVENEDSTTSESICLDHDAQQAYDKQ